MAKQQGIIQFSGAIDNLQFFKGKDGAFHVRRKSTVDKNKITTDPSFKRTREAMAEFATAAKGGKLIRDALNSLVTKVADKNLATRLTTTLVKILKSDAQNERGHKQLMLGQLNLLKGFEFSPTGSVNSTFKGKYTPLIDRSNGKLSITIEEFTPSRDVYKPKEATHFQFHAAALAINFDTGATEYSISSSQKIEWNNAAVALTKLESAVQLNTPDPMFLLFAIEFWKFDSSGTYYELMNRVYNGVVIADTSQV